MAVGESGGDRRAARPRGRAAAGGGYSRRMVAGLTPFEVTGRGATVL